MGEYTNVSLKGKVVSGMSVGAKIMLDYLHKFKETFGLDIFPGTLNIQLEEDFDFLKSEYIEAFEKSDGTKRGRVYFLKAKISGFAVFLIRPEKTGHPKNILEIVSDKNLRERFSIKDNDFLGIIMD